MRLGIWHAILAVIISGFIFFWSHDPVIIAVWALCSGIALAFWHRYMDDPGAIPVLIYHSVSADSRWLPWSENISVSPETFECHLKVLQSMGCTALTTRDLVNGRLNGKTQSRRPVVIHLDDGYLDNWVAALPLLKRYDMPATIFVSADFISPEDEPRPTLEDVVNGSCAPADLRWDGYLNAAEMRAMVKSGPITIGSHGVTHSRVSSGPRVIGQVTPENWRSLVSLQWRRGPGPKHDWYKRAGPMEIPIGAEVRENASALAAREWNEGYLETEKSFIDRVNRELKDSREILSRISGQSAEIFCWPFNERAARGHELALASGYLAATGGPGENREDEDPREISRIHIGGNTLGWKCLAVEALMHRAVVRLGQGCYYWYLLVLPLSQWTKVVRQIKGLWAKGGR